MTNARSTRRDDTRAPGTPALLLAEGQMHVLPAAGMHTPRGVTRMRKAWVTLAVLVAILTSKVSPAQAQTQVQAQTQEEAPRGPTLGGHIGVLFPLVTNAGGQTST